MRLGSDVTALAGGREAGGDVVGFGPALEGGEVAADALARRFRKHAAGVARQARLGCMDALERRRRSVVERPLVPARVRDAVAGVSQAVGKPAVA